MRFWLLKYLLHWDESKPMTNKNVDIYRNTEINIFQLYGLSLKKQKAQETIALWMHMSIHRNCLNYIWTCNFRSAQWCYMMHTISYNAGAAALDIIPRDIPRAEAEKTHHFHLGKFTLVLLLSQTACQCQSGINSS